MCLLWCLKPFVSPTSKSPCSLVIDAKEAVPHQISQIWGIAIVPQRNMFLLGCISLSMSLLSQSSILIPSEDWHTYTYIYILNTKSANWLMGSLDSLVQRPEIVQNGFRNASIPYALNISVQLNPFDYTRNFSHCSFRSIYFSTKAIGTVWLIQYHKYNTHKLPIFPQFTIYY